EKAITLATGFALRSALAKSGHRVAMTRTHDVFVSLPDRVAMTIHARASLFISLHCNHLADTSLRGALVFSLSHKPSDALAASIAKTENSFDRGPLSPQYRGVSPEVAGILASLTTHATMVGSKKLADNIVSAFEHHVLLLPNPDRSANFAVLRDPLVPANLIEMGCISNPADAALLRTARYRTLLASRVALAADHWLAHGRFARIAG
ncbi:MAG TPA: N-acetylmuramoyl-L-alanine amidase, partial [Acidiphilium sp.]